MAASHSSSVLSQSQGDILQEAMSSLSEHYIQGKLGNKYIGRNLGWEFYNIQTRALSCKTILVLKYLNSETG